MLQLHPAYSLWNRRKTLTGSPDPMRANGTNKPCTMMLLPSLKTIEWLQNRFAAHFKRLLWYNENNNTSIIAVVVGLCKRRKRWFLPPANVVCEGYVFTHVCHSVHRGTCVVAPGGVDAPGGVRGWSGGCVWLLRGGACVVALGGVHGIRRDTEIRSMSGRYASYWNAFLLLGEIIFHQLW